MLLGFLPQLLLWMKLLVKVIKNVGKTWLYTSVSRYKKLMLQNINTFFMALTLMTAVGQPLPLSKYNRIPVTVLS